MAQRQIQATFGNPNVEAVRVFVCQYRRRANQNQQERARMKELVRQRVRETVDATFDPVIRKWVASVTVPNLTQGARFLRAVIRIEGLVLTRDATGKVIGSRAVASLTLPPFRPV